MKKLAGAKGNPFRNRMTNLGGVSVLSIMTTPHKAYRWWYRDPLTKILFKGTFAKIGVKNLRWANYASVTNKTPEQRDQMLHDTEKAFSTLQPSGRGPDRNASQEEGMPPRIDV